MVFFGMLGLAVTRMKYLWTPYMCVSAALCVGDYTLWKWILEKLASRSKTLVRRMTFEMRVTHYKLYMHKYLYIHCNYIHTCI